MDISHYYSDISALENKRRKNTDNHIVNQHLNTNNNNVLNLLDLPEEVLRTILKLIDFETLARILRLVCQRLKCVSESILTVGFLQLRIKMNSSYQESHLSRQVPICKKQQIIIFLSEQLDQLHFMFIDHLRAGCCCFFPGSLLDEAYSLYNLTLNNQNPKNSNKPTFKGAALALGVMNTFYIFQDKLIKFLSCDTHFVEYYKKNNTQNKSFMFYFYMSKRSPYSL